jgi:hypothetical protein
MTYYDLWIWDLNFWSSYLENFVARSIEMEWSSDGEKLFRFPLIVLEFEIWFYGSGEEGENTLCQFENKHRRGLGWI